MKNKLINQKNKKIRKISKIQKKVIYFPQFN